MLTKIKCSIDFLPGKQFDGYGMDEDWNGFARPYFTFDQAADVLKAAQEQGQNGKYNATDDAFEFTFHDNVGEPEIESFSCIAIKGHALYPIGAGSWAWSSEAL